jgi:hypothetical protein
MPLTFDISDLRRHVSYDAATGKLYWLPRLAEDFTDARRSREGIALLWNAKNAGREALASVNVKGYKTGKYQGQALRAHRAVWLLHNDTWPEQLDHINGDKSDNRIENLRAADHTINARNQPTYRNCRYGAMGIRPVPSGNWQARLRVNGRETSLGTYPTKEDAAAAYRTAAVANGYHPNHAR